MCPLRQDRAHRQVKGCNGKSRVRSVTVESSEEQDDHFVMYIVDALESSDIRVPVFIDDTTFDMQLDTAADVSLLPESVPKRHEPLAQQGDIVLKTY